MPTPQHNGQRTDQPVPNPGDGDEVVEQIMESPEGELFESGGFGLGNYDEQLYWQQVRGFRKSLVAHLCFASTLKKRAIAETKRRLAVEGIEVYDAQSDRWIRRDPWHELGDDERAESRYADCDGLTLDEYAEQVWDKLGSDVKNGLSRKQRVAIEEKAGFESRFASTFEKLENIRHEASRSRGARLLDDILGAAQILRNESGGLEDEVG